MKNSLYLILIASFFIFNFPELNNYPQKTNKIPYLNKRIIKFVDKNMGKQIGRGECWDLAAQALDYAGAKWDGSWQFGKVVDYKKDKIYPGDIIQFTNIKTEYTKENVTYYGTMTQHTVIIYKVNGTGDYILAEQNTPHSGRNIGLGKINFKHITEGKFTVYRPVN